MRAAATRRRDERAVPTVKVIDFGVAKAVAEKTNAMALTHGGFVGTPAFASPEQFTNAPVDVRSDIYSLGATLWFLLTGHMLFSGRTIEEIQDARRSKPLPIDQLKAARVPQRFISLLTSMLAIEPAALLRARASSGRDFLVRTASLCNGDAADGPARRDGAKRALENAQKLEPNSPEPCSPWVTMNTGCCGITELPKPRSVASARCYPVTAMPYALGQVARREGSWDESIAYFEQALTLDPRNVKLLMDAGITYAVLRQFPAALKLYDRVLDITPYDADVMAAKATIYQAQGNLQEAARFLSEIDQQTPSGEAFNSKLTELRLQRNYGEAIRLLQVRQDQFNFASPHDKGFEQVWLALIQRLAGDTAGATATAQQARNTLEPLYRHQPDNWLDAPPLSQAYAVMGEKDSALNLAEQALALLPSAKDRADGPALEENLAFIQMIVGENSRAISILSQLSQTPYSSWIYSPGPITPALLRLDPFWDPLRGDPAFQKLCEEKQGLTTNGH